MDRKLKIQAYEELLRDLGTLSIKVEDPSTVSMAYMDGFVACLNLIRKEIEQLSKEKEGVE